MEYYSIIKEIEGLNLQAHDRTKDATHCSHIGPLQKNFAYSSSIIFLSVCSMRHMWRLGNMKRAFAEGNAFREGCIRRQLK